jgi:hypothetical protein
VKEEQLQKGFQGTRLGPPYEYRWIDMEPTQTTWKNLSEQRGVFGALIGLFSVLIISYVLGGDRGLILGFLFFGGVGAAIGGLTGRYWGRTDDEPVPLPVRREAWIEHVSDGEFYFMLVRDGRLEFWDKWNRVEQFEVVEYWPMFGDAGISPYKTGWHAIIMTPSVGKPWLIASTMEAMAPIRERFTTIVERFGADQRSAFMKAVERKEKAQEFATEANTTKSSNTPEQLNTSNTSIPNIL